MVENLFISTSRCQDGCHKDSSYKGRFIFVWLHGGLSSFAQSMEKSQWGQERFICDLNLKWAMVENQVDKVDAKMAEIKIVEL